MICPYCKKEALFVSNKVIYGKRFGKSHMVYYCKDCDAYVGVHNNDPLKPKGTMAKRELRGMRIRAHEDFDKLWKRGLMTRSEAYTLLASKLGVNEIHIGESNERVCMKIIKVVKEYLKENPINT